MGIVKTKKPHETEIFGWAWRIQSTIPTLWDFTVNPEDIAIVREVPNNQGKCRGCDIVALVVDPQVGDRTPFGWAWRPTALGRWNFTTAPEHITAIRQMAADRNRTWEIVALFRSTDLAG